MMGQSPQFSQFYANQVYLNPAFTGNTQVNRLAGNYRNQWAGLPKAFVSYSIAYDHNFAMINSGLGLMAIRDQAGVGGLSYTNFSALYSYKFALRENLMASAGISYGVSIRAADASSYVFGDEFITGGATTADINERKVYGDFGAGFLVYNSKLWGGLSVAHLNRPNESLVANQKSRVPMLWTFHGGYTFVLSETKSGVIEKSLIVAANYKSSAKFDQIDLGVYYNPKRVILGLWYRGLPLLKKNEGGGYVNDAIIVLFGLKWEHYRIGYSYDITSSKLEVSNSYGSHEISMTYEWPTKTGKKKKRKKNFIAPCPKF